MNTYFKSLLFTLLFLCSITVSFSQKQKKGPKNGVKKIESPYFQNLFQLNDSIFRSEQPDKKGYGEIHQLKIKSILSLYPNSEDKKLTWKYNFDHYHVNMYSDDFSDKDIAKALYFIEIAHKPLLIHCKHGSDRTGLVIAMYRIMFNNWTRQNAIDEMKKGDFGFNEKYENMIEYIQKVDLTKIKKKIKEMESEE